MQVVSGGDRRDDCRLRSRFVVRRPSVQNGLTITTATQDAMTKSGLLAARVARQPRDKRAPDVSIKRILAIRAAPQRGTARLPIGLTVDRSIRRSISIYRSRYRSLHGPVPLRPTAARLVPLGTGSSG